MSETENSGSNFIREIIDQDLEDGRFTEIHTRFPPEPNGYLHIGHAKSILLNYGIAQAYNGKFNLRFDDTNPVTEEVEFIESIQHDIRWLGVDWEDRLLFASDYFDQLYAYAIDLIKKGLAYVDDLSQEEIREYRGTLTEPGKESPYRNRSIEENLDLFERMKNGEFEEGSKVLRAKIDMTSPNMNFRDPLLYRIVYAHHPRTGDKWCIYPLYDWAHGQSDSIEQISHSICTLEFEDHRPLYNWFIEKLGIFHPRQIEFARFNLTHTVMSKRKLLQLVQDKHVNGWDDPRMPTIAGMRRRGYSSSALAAFMEKVGVAKANSTIDFALLEHVIRQEYEEKAQRAFAVIDPVKVVITNYPEDQEEEFDVKRWPQDEESTEIRKVPFSREIYIDRDDFMVDPPRKYFRLAPEREVRLMHAYYITCTDYVLDDETGEVKEIHCTYDPETRGGMSPDGRRVKGTIHWVSARHALDAELRLYDHLFLKENPYETEEGKDFTSNINPDSLIITKNSKLEPALAAADPDDHYQFMRKGYFVVDEKDSKPDALVFNRTISLRDSWAKIQKKN